MRYFFASPELLCLYWIQRAKDWFGDRKASRGVGHNKEAYSIWISTKFTEAIRKGYQSLKIKTVRSVLDVNKATALDFQKVYGIGPVYSKRIVKFRAIFGGFVHMDQLQQVYGLDTIVVKH